MDKVEASFGLSWYKLLFDRTCRREAWGQEQMAALAKLRKQRSVREIVGEVIVDDPIRVVPELLAAQQARAREIRALITKRPACEVRLPTAAELAAAKRWEQLGEEEKVAPAQGAPKPTSKRGAPAREEGAPKAKRGAVMKVASPCEKPVENSKPEKRGAYKIKAKPVAPPVEKPKPAPKRAPKEPEGHIPLKLRKRKAATKEQRTAAIARAMDRHKERSARQRREQQVYGVSHTYPGEGWWTRDGLASVCGRSPNTVRNWVKSGWVERQTVQCSDGQWRERYRPIKPRSIESLSGSAADYPGEGWYSADTLAAEVGKTRHAVRCWAEQGRLIEERVRGVDGKWRLRYQLARGQEIDELKAPQVKSGGSRPQDGRVWLSAGQAYTAHDLTLNALAWLIGLKLCDVALGGATQGVAYVAPAEGQTWASLVEANRERVSTQRRELAKVGRAAQRKAKKETDHG